MNNPFDLIDSKLNHIETLLLEIVNLFESEEVPDEVEKLLTVEETAEFLNLSTPTIYSKVSKGELPVMKRGKRLYFSRTELLDYLKAGRKLSNADIEAAADAYFENKKRG